MGLFIGSEDFYSQIVNLPGWFVVKTIGGDSVRMGRRGRVPLYGPVCSPATPVQPCNGADICLTGEFLTKFVSILTLTEEMINTSRLSGTATSTIIAKVPSSVFMNDWTYVRFVWMNLHKDKIFDPMNIQLRYQIKDIYLRLGWSSWRDDSLVNTLP